MLAPIGAQARSLRPQDDLDPERSREMMGEMVSSGNGQVTQMVRDSIGPVALLAVGANVVMQLALLPIGRGVAESRVEGGRLDAHPVKRFRTTVGYLAVALLGSDDERRAVRREVDRSHGPVHSLPEDPVRYDAFDPELQLWVAACLYRGVELSRFLMHGTPDAETAEALYRHCARLGTTLQVTDDMWPPSREAFEGYWTAMAERIQMDEVTRRYLMGVARLRFLPRPVSWVLGGAHTFFLTGFLPEPFRAELRISWGSRREAAFRTITRTGGRLTAGLPFVVRAFPLNLCLWDTRRRIHAGRPFV
jgi:uncharacterized protein (DUF2236 family)